MTGKDQKLLIFLFIWGDTVQNENTSAYNSSNELQFIAFYSTLGCCFWVVSVFLWSWMGYAGCALWVEHGFLLLTEHTSGSLVSPVAGI